MPDKQQQPLPLFERMLFTSAISNISAVVTHSPYSLRYALEHNRVLAGGIKQLGASLRVKLRIEAETAHEMSHDSHT